MRISAHIFAMKFILSFLFFMISVAVFAQNLDTETQIKIQQTFKSAQSNFKNKNHAAALKKIAEIEALGNGVVFPTAQLLKIKALFGAEEFAQAQMEIATLRSWKPSAEIVSQLDEYDGRIAFEIETQKQWSKERADLKLKEFNKSVERLKKEDADKRHYALMRSIEENNIVLAQAQVKQMKKSNPNLTIFPFLYEEPVTRHFVMCFVDKTGKRISQERLTFIDPPLDNVFRVGHFNGRETAYNSKGKNVFVDKYYSEANISNDGHIVVKNCEGYGCKYSINYGVTESCKISSYFGDTKFVFYANDGWPVWLDATGYYINHVNLKKVTDMIPSACHRGLFCAKKNGKYGWFKCVGAKRKKAISFKYEAVASNSFLHANLAIVKYNGQWGGINTADEIIIPFGKYKKLFAASKEGLIPAQFNSGLWGYITIDGKTVIEPQFSFAADFSNGIAAIQKDGKMGYINTKGEHIIKPIYEFPSSEILKKNGIDARGKFINFEKGIILLYKDGKWGAATIEGEILSNCKYDYLMTVSYGGYVCFSDYNRSEENSVWYDTFGNEYTRRSKTTHEKNQR